MLQCLFRSGLSISETYLPSFARAEHGSKLVLHIIISVLYIYRVIVLENKYADHIFGGFFAIIEMITYDLIPARRPAITPTSTERHLTKKAPVLGCPIVCIYQSIGVLSLKKTHRVQI